MADYSVQALRKIEREIVEDEVARHQGRLRCIMVNCGRALKKHPFQIVVGDGETLLRVPWECSEGHVHYAERQL